MVALLHEIWIESDDNGQDLESCCLAGKDGEEFRKSLSSNARLMRTFEASSHYEAMTIFHEILGREKYTTTHEWAYLPYPEE